MSGGTEEYQKIIRQKRCRLIAMQIFAGGTIPPKEALKYVCEMDGIESILFGASSRANITNTKELINLYRKTESKKFHAEGDQNS